MVKATTVAALCERRGFLLNMGPAVIDRRYRSTPLVSRELLPLNSAAATTLTPNPAVTGRRLRTNLGAVAANCLDRATFHRLFAQRFFLGRFGLFINVGMAAVIITTEVRRSGFTAEVTVNALVIDIELSVDIFGVFICGVSHFSKLLVKRRGY
jgi:hypothetical protein